MKMLVVSLILFAVLSVDGVAQEYYAVGAAGGRQDAYWQGLNVFETRVFCQTAPNLRSQRLSVFGCMIPRRFKKLHFFLAKSGSGRRV